MALGYSFTGKTSSEASLMCSMFRTYFLFPFALDKEAIREDNPQAWPGKTHWIDGLDTWIAGESGRSKPPGMAALGPWRRSTYSNFSLDSDAYTDLLFFHPVIRYVFFDANLGHQPDDQLNQFRWYAIDLERVGTLWFEGSDALGTSARIHVTSLRLHLSAHGTGVLSIGVGADNIDITLSTWINRRMRKVYPDDGGSIKQGRTPNRLALTLETGSDCKTISEERFEAPTMVGFNPPLANTIRSLLYFADYSLQEYAPVLDENMSVYSYAELDLERSRQFDIEGAMDPLVDRFIHLGHKHSPDDRQTYSDTAVLVGSTAHSCSILAWPTTDGRRTLLKDGSSTSSASVAELGTIRSFQTRYYLMVVIATFYRAVLLDFTERSALVSRRLLQDQVNGKLTLSSIQMVNELRAEFLNFSSYWHFDDVTSKRAANALFRRLCDEYSIEPMKKGLADELRHMSEFVNNYYQLANTEAVNRLAILSLIFGSGAVLTGFFGMNFGREFGKFFFEGEGGSPVFHYVIVAFVICAVFGSLAFGTLLILANWKAYLQILAPRRRSSVPQSLKRDAS